MPRHQSRRRSTVDNDGDLDLLVTTTADPRVGSQKSTCQLEPITIDQLGLWDSGANGLGVAGVQTGLWTSAGALLASAIITDASEQVASASANGEWLFEDIGALVLLPGSYVIGSVFFGAVPLAQIGAPFFTIAQIALTGGVRSGGSNDGFAFLDTAFGSPVFGATMRLADVPEPATLALVALGLTLAGLRRRARSPRA